MKRGSALAYTLVVLLLISMIATAIFMIDIKEAQNGNKNFQKEMDRLVLREEAYNILNDKLASYETDVPAESNAFRTVGSMKVYYVYDYDSSNYTLSLGFSADYLLEVKGTINGTSYAITNWKDGIR